MANQKQRLLKNYWLSSPEQKFLVKAMFFLSTSLIGAVIFFLVIFTHWMGEEYLTEPYLSFWILISMLSLALIGSGVATIVLSHRIVGPLYSIIATIDRFQNGDKEARVHLRKNDQLKELADKINKVLGG
jgi:methyl-accepting chemotaxis protein